MKSLAILLWRADRRLLLAAAVLSLALGALPNAIVVVSGRFVGSTAAAIDHGLSSPAGHRALIALGALAVAFALTGVFMSLVRLLSELMNTQYVRTVADMVGDASLAPRYMDAIDNPKIAAELGSLSDFERSGLQMQAVPSLRMVVSRRVSGIGACGVLFTFRWWVPLVLAAGWLVANRGSSRWMDRGFTVTRAEGGDRLRRAEYVRGLAVRAESAKELRIFGLADWVGRQYVDSWLTAMSAVWQARRASAGDLAAGVAALALAHAGVFAFMGWQASAGHLAIGDVTMYGMAVLGTAELGFLGDPQWRVRRANTLAEQILNLPARLGADRTDVPAATASPRVTSGAAEISLTGVRFGYAASASPVLLDVHLHIPAGQSLAVVGENGAGKTTLLKLLCGLYRPDAGTVRIDGMDVSALDSNALERRIGVIFQNFVRYELPLRENVGFGDLDLLDAADQLVAALRDAGGADLPDALPAGWQTVLAGGYDRGVDLSGGQWQRVALARALTAVRGGAGLLILDEPTASLDVRAETELFDRFLSLTRNVTTILVSHRLSSVRHADRIVVLEAGRIIEDGTHAALLAAGGRYARMFRMQADRFVTAETGDA